MGTNIFYAFFKLKNPSFTLCFLFFSPPLRDILSTSRQQVCFVAITSPSVCACAVIWNNPFGERGGEHITTINPEKKTFIMNTDIRQRLKSIYDTLTRHFKYRGSESQPVYLTYWEPTGRQPPPSLPWLHMVAVKLNLSDSCPSSFKIYVYSTCDTRNICLFPPRSLHWLRTKRFYSGV